MHLDGKGTPQLNPGVYFFRLKRLSWKFWVMEQKKRAREAPGNKGR